MSQLDDLCARLNQQLLDPSGLVLARESVAEAFRTALGRINLTLSRQESLEGLDGAPVTTLNAQQVSVLIMGAAAHAFSMLSARGASQFSQEEEDLNTLSLLQRHAEQQFEQGLERLRLLESQSQSLNLPYAAWEKEPGTGAAG